MRYQLAPDAAALLECSADEVLTLRHCVIEALEALSDEEFLIRTGGPKSGAESLLAVLKQVTRDLGARDGGS